MASLDSKLKTSKDSKFRSSKNMTTDFRHVSTAFETELNPSILRGNLLRYATVIPDVQEHLKDLKASNPLYLSLLNKIIITSITSNETIDINMCDSSSGESVLALLLRQFNDASYNNTEVLDFTKEVLNCADNLTSKYYLAHLAAGIMSNHNLKAQFSSAIPFVRYLVSATLNPDSNDLTPQKNFMTGVKLIINEKADVNKIALLPKLKQIVDDSSKKEHNIDIVKFIYSKASLARINLKLTTLPNALYTAERNNKSLDCVGYLIQNSL